jgi:hypothetical protein
MRWLNDGKGGSWAGVTRDFQPVGLLTKGKVLLGAEKNSLVTWWNARHLCILLKDAIFRIDATKWALISLCNTCLIALNEGWMWLNRTC